MKPLFTIHAGEFLVGDYISRKLGNKFDVWLPVRDTGVDLLATPKRRRRKTKAVKLQVKFSRGFGAKRYEPEFVARGWYTLNPAKIVRSKADVWVFVILTLRQEAHYVIVPLKELKHRIPRPHPRVWHLYLTVYEGGRCFNTRDWGKEKVRAALDGRTRDRKRDFTRYLNNWKVLSS